MPNGFSSPGGFNNNRTTSTFFGSTYTIFPYSNVLYNPLSNRPKIAYAILSNGNSSAKRIKNHNYDTFALKKLSCETRALY